MPRQARVISNSGYYHILLRGNAKSLIFEDDFDRIKFIEILHRYKLELNFEIDAYCLMDNHIHLLIKDPNNQLELIMKKIAISYAYYFNLKYDRTGHLFQDRFKSEPIEDENYFITAVRYIHQNPCKAGICSVAEYRWSSYTDYLKDQDLIDTYAALELLDGLSGFEEFHTFEEDTTHIDVFEKPRITDKIALQIIISVAHTENVSQIQQLDKTERNKIIKQLKLHGISTRQISRLTGIGRGVIQNI